MKKFVLALLAVVLVLGLSSVALADHKDGCIGELNTYTVYLDEDGDKVSSIICGNTYTKQTICRDCDGVVAEETKFFDHELTSKVNAPTCEDQGEAWEYCTRPGCGYQTKKVITPALDHYPLNGDVDHKPATCTEDGYVKFVCGRCGETQTETLKKHEHVYLKTFEEVRDADKKAPTCTEDGYAIFRCICDKCDCTEDKLVVYPKLNHKYENGKTAWYLHAVTAAPTCTEDGVGIEKCDLCGAERSCVVDALKHDWTEFTVIVEPLCETDGYKSRICTRPGCKDGRNGKAAEEVVVMPKLGHDEISKVTKAATCTAEGSKTVTCKRCAKVWTEVVPMIDHSWTEWTVVGDCKVRTCKVCHKIENCTGECPADPETPVVPDKPTTGDDDNNNSEGGSSSTGSGSDASIPATGDNTSNVPYIMMVAAVAGLVVLVASKRKVNC